MPAVNPRINVSLQPETHRAIARIAMLTGQSKSAIVGAMVEDQSQVLQELATVLSEARFLGQPVSGSLTAKVALRSQDVEEAQKAAQTALHELIEDIRANVPDRSERAGCGL